MYVSNHSYRWGIFFKTWLAEYSLCKPLFWGNNIFSLQPDPLHSCQWIYNLIIDHHCFQVPLTPAVQAQIRGDVRYMAEITECLASLNITIGFLVTIGGEPETMLQTFMTDTLQMDPAILTPKVRMTDFLSHSMINFISIIPVTFFS